MSKLNPFDRDYLRLVLEIEKHIPGYIDAYIGPSALSDDVNAGAKKDPAILLQELKCLRDNIPQASLTRANYLTATLRAIETTLRILSGETFDYLEEVQLLYDVQPELVDEDTFSKAHEELDTLLPGKGTLAQRVQQRRKQYELAPEKVLPLIQLARDETRGRTAKLIELVEGEDLEVRLASNQPWGAYNWYLGNAKSLVEFNTDVPISAIGLITIFAHEAYPGHHTEQQLKEKYLYKGKGYSEQAVILLHAPAAVISEGIARMAAEIIFPIDSRSGDYHTWNENVMCPAAGIKSESAEQMRNIANATRSLRYVSHNVAILYHTGRLNRDEALDYLSTYGLLNQERAEKIFGFLSHRLFRAYVITYTSGYELISQAVNGDSTTLFRRLLHEQILPSDLAAMGAEGKRK